MNQTGTTAIMAPQQKEAPGRTKIYVDERAEVFHNSLVMMMPPFLDDEDGDEPSLNDAEAFGSGGGEKRKVTSASTASLAASSKLNSSASQTSMIRMVVDEIRQTLIEQGVDVGSALDDPSIWEKLIEESKGDLSASALPAYQSPIDEVVVTRVAPGADGYASSHLTVCSDITEQPLPPSHLPHHHHHSLEDSSSSLMSMNNKNKNNNLKNSTSGGKEEASQATFATPTPSTTADHTPPTLPKTSVVPKSPRSGHRAPTKSPRGKKRRSGLKRKDSLMSIRLEEANDPNQLFPGFEEYLDESLEYQHGASTSGSAAPPSLSTLVSSNAGGSGGDDNNSEGSCHIARRRASSSALIMMKANRSLSDRSTTAGSSTVSNNNNNNNNNNIKAAGVRFNTIEIRHYERIVCDNPACIGGPPIGIGWKYRRSQSFELEEWELLRGHRRTVNEMLLARTERERLCREWGHSDKDIALATRQSRIVQYQRKRTVDNLDMRTQRFEEAMESAVRKAKRIFGLTVSTTSSSSTSKLRQ